MCKIEWLVERGVHGRNWDEARVLELNDKGDTDK
jgi:hypothetical protein